MSSLTRWQQYQLVSVPDGSVEDWTSVEQKAFYGYAMRSIEKRRTFLADLLEYEPASKTFTPDTIKETFDRIEALVRLTKAETDFTEPPGRLVSVGIDLALAVGQSCVESLPYLRWELHTKNPRHVLFGLPVVTGWKNYYPGFSFHGFYSYPLKVESMWTKEKVYDSVTEDYCEMYVDEPGEV